MNAKKRLEIAKQLGGQVRRQLAGKLFFDLGLSDREVAKALDAARAKLELLEQHIEKALEIEARAAELSADN